MGRPSCFVLVLVPCRRSDLEMHEVAKLDVKLVEARLDEGAVSMVEAVGKAVGKAVSGRIGAHQMNPFAKLYIRRVRGRIEESFACVSRKSQVTVHKSQVAIQSRKWHIAGHESWIGPGSSRKSHGASYESLVTSTWGKVCVRGHWQSTSCKPRVMRVDHGILVVCFPRSFQFIC